MGLGEFDFGALHYRVDACGILGYHMVIKDRKNIGRARWGIIS